MSDPVSAVEAPTTGDRRRFDPALGRLVGGKCMRCGAQTWPRRSACYRCGTTEVAEIVLPAKGRLTTWTRVWIPVEGLEVPYCVGQVELDGVLLFAHIRGVTDEATMPADVVVRVDTSQQPPFWFEVTAP